MNTLLRTTSTIAVLMLSACGGGAEHRKGGVDDIDRCSVRPHSHGVG